MYTVRLVSGTTTQAVYVFTSQSRAIKAALRLCGTGSIYERDEVDPEKRRVGHAHSPDCRLFAHVWKRTDGERIL